MAKERNTPTPLAERARPPQPTTDISFYAAVAWQGNVSLEPNTCHLVPLFKHLSPMIREARLLHLFIKAAHKSRLASCTILYEAIVHFPIQTAVRKQGHVPCTCDSLSVLYTLVLKTLVVTAHRVPLPPLPTLRLELFLRRSRVQTMRKPSERQIAVNPVSP